MEHLQNLVTIFPEYYLIGGRMWSAGYVCVHYRAFNKTFSRLKYLAVFVKYLAVLKYLAVFVCGSFGYGHIKHD